MKEIEVRMATLEDGRTELDEIVASNARVHLEKMSDSEFALIVETTHERACFSVGAARARVNASTTWHEPRNGRAEGQKRRWNRASEAQRKRHGRRVSEARRIPHDKYTRDGACRYCNGVGCDRCKRGFCPTCNPKGIGEV